MAKKTTAKKATGIAKQSSRKKGELISIENYGMILDPSALEVLQCNLGGESLSEFDLDQVHVPAGGGTSWSVPTLNGDKNMDEIIGIVLGVYIRRGFWEATGPPDGSPPDCSSSDGLVGIGDPGGPCAACQWNVYGTAISDVGQPGKGKRCREMRAILVLREEDTLPIVICAPPTSLKGTKRYLMRLPVQMHKAMTRITLVKAAKQPPHSIVEFSYVGHIGDAGGEKMKGFAKLMRETLKPSSSPLLAQMRSDPDFQNDSDEGGQESQYGVDSEFMGPNDDQGTDEGDS